jgi:hypothetical protein
MEKLIQKTKEYCRWSTAVYQLPLSYCRVQQAKRLPQHPEYHAMLDANGRIGVVVQAVNFHPGFRGPLLLTAGLDKTLQFFFQVGKRVRRFTEYTVSFVGGSAAVLNSLET